MLKSPKLRQCADSLSIEDGRGEELAPIQSPADKGHRVLATDSEGNSLTLLEEYAMRRKDRVSSAELALSFACAAAALAFAALIYLNTQ